MADHLPPPPIPADADLRDFQFMPIDIVRLFGSTFHARANDSEWRAGVTLWLKSYHQVPAGSLPNDDIELCRLAELGRDHKTWKKIRAMAMHGWWEASDGRLYHSVVAEKATEAWRRKGEQKVRTLKARIAAMEKRHKDAGNPEEKAHIGSLLDGLRQSLSQTLAKPATDQPSEPVTETNRQGQGQGQVSKKEERAEPNGSGAGRPPDFAAMLFGACRQWLVAATGKNDAACRTLLGKWRKSLPDGDLVQLLKSAQEQGHLEDPVSWVEKAIQARKPQPRRQHGADFN